MSKYKTSTFSFIQDKEFQTLLERVTALSSKSPLLSMTIRLKHVVLRAQKNTATADKIRINQDLGVGTKLRLKKSGKGFLKTKNARTFSAGMLYRIVNARLKGRGKEIPKTREEMTKAAQKEYNRRMRSIGLLKQGYLRGLRILARESGKPMRKLSTKALHRLILTPSTASVIKLRQGGVVEFTYRLGGTTIDKKSTGVPKQVQEALTRSANVEKREMAQHIGKKFADQVKKLARGGKVKR